jgi:hypothetical protein
MLMPASTIADQDGMSAQCNPNTDNLEVFVHGFGIGMGHDKGGTHGAARADGAENIGRNMPVSRTIRGLEPTGAQM